MPPNQDTVPSYLANRRDYFAKLDPGRWPDPDWREALSPTLSLAEPQWSQGFEELVIRDFFGDRRDGFYVDIGCAWPYRSSTTCYLEKHLGWGGLAVDALSDYAAQWQSERPATRFINCAVSDTPDPDGIFYRHDWTGVSSLHPEMAARYGGSGRLTEVRVEVTTLDTLLEAHGVTAIDHLTLDIEGAEAAALAGFDIRRYRPALCCVEGVSAEILDYFLTHGYQQIDRYRKVDKINGYFCPRRG